jgi:uncharacterized membrane protein
MRTVRAFAAVSYPFLVLLGLRVLPPRVLAMWMAAIPIAVAVFAWKRGRLTAELSGTLPAAFLAVTLAIAALFNEARVFLLVPAMTNVAFLFSFGRTLVKGPSMAEIFARMRRRDLPEGAVEYCRKLTGLWCVFFGLNSAFIIWLALYASLAWWTVYTGFIAYVLAGTLFLLELAYRQQRFRHV